MHIALQMNRPQPQPRSAPLFEEAPVRTPGRGAEPAGPPPTELPGETTGPNPIRSTEIRERTGATEVIEIPGG